jgi:hypothetical protein
MPFGLGKSDKQPEHEDHPPTEEALRGSQGTGTADPPNPGGQPKEDIPDAMAFRPAFLDSDTPSERAPAAQPPTDDIFFVSVTRDGNTETYRFDDPSEAQAFVEQILEEGVPQEEVTAFSGRRVALRVTHRPIVKLVASQDD